MDGFKAYLTWMAEHKHVCSIFWPQELHNLYGMFQAENPWPKKFTRGVPSLVKLG